MCSTFVNYASARDLENDERSARDHGRDAKAYGTTTYAAELNLYYMQTNSIAIGRNEKRRDLKFTMASNMSD